MVDYDYELLCPGCMETHEHCYCELLDKEDQ